jgi:hypothetical protein
MLASDLKSRLNALLVVQGGSPGDGGGGLDAILWVRQVDLSSVISSNMGRLAVMAAATASAKDASAPGAVDNGAGALSSLSGGGGGKVMYKLCWEGVFVGAGGGNMGAAPSGSAVPKRHSPSIIL